MTSDIQKALKVFADLGVGSGPDHETETYQIERGAIRNARAALELKSVVSVDAVLAELMDRRLLNDVDSDLHQEIAEAVIKAAQPAVDEDGPLSIRDIAMIDQAWENHKAALPVATVVNDNQPGRTAIIEITIDPPTLPVGTKLYAGPKMVELAAETSPGDVVDDIAKWLHDETGHPESYPNHTWPETDRDDGQREGGFVKIVPLHAQEYFRDIARRLVARYPVLQIQQKEAQP